MTDNSPEDDSQVQGLLATQIATQILAVLQDKGPILEDLVVLHLGSNHPDDTRSVLKDLLRIEWVTRTPDGKVEIAPNVPKRLDHW